MTRKIIAATDFSATAYHAALFAAAWAEQIKADLILFHVEELPASVSAVYTTRDEENARRQAELQISRIKNELQRKFQHTISIQTVVDYGEFFQSLENYCADVAPYVVVVGTQGTSALRRVMMGSHSVQIMQHLSWPVIAVPPNAVYSPITTIGLAVDFSRLPDGKALETIRELLHDFPAKLLIIHSAEKNVYDPTIVFEAGHLETLLNDIKATYHFIAHRHTDEGVLAFAESQGVNLLLVIPQRHNLLERIWHKSNTKQLVLHSEIPVMALRGAVVEKEQNHHQSPIQKS